MGIISTQLTGDTTLATNGKIPVGDIIHKNCTKLNASGSNWTVKGVGYFKATANVQIAPTTAGDITISLNDNGAEVATAFGTTETAGDAVTLPIQYVGLNDCACCTHVLTITVSAPSTVTECDMIIERM